MKYLGLDIGGSKIAVVVMDEQGHEWRRFRVETRKQTRRQFIATLVALITAIVMSCSAFGYRYRPAGEYFP